MGDQTDGFELQLKDYEIFQNFYKNFDQNDTSIVRFFQHKDHHAVHGQTAVFIADQYFKTQSAVKHSSKGHAYLGMREAMFENVVRDLLCEQGKKVEVYVGSRDKWQLSRNASPGNLQGFEDLLDSNPLHGSSAIVALRPAREDSQRVMGIAVADASLFTLGMCEFVDDDQFSSLEAVLVQLSARECLVPSDIDKYEREKLGEVLQRCQVVLTERKRGDLCHADSSP
jgi:DNA mismatch repair protein MSH2